MNCDLHTHSIYSDGTWTPAQIVEEAARLNLTVALTDHNSISGLPEFLGAAWEKQVTAVAGTEFTTEFLGTELHIVALFIPEEHYGTVREYVSQTDRLKAQSNRALVEKLCAAGYQISYDEIVAQTPDGRVNRANIGAELVKKGYMPTVKDAFRQLLRESCGYYMPPKRPDAVETVAFIRSIGALPVLAHPLLSMDEEKTRTFLPLAKARGLMAMETMYTTYDETTTALAKRLAAEFGLLESGGSDFHGDNKPGVLLGQGRGNLCIPDSVYKALLTAQQNKL